MRTYGQFCPIARGSEILAERWTPIILRNLLMGCRTFNQIAAGAPGLSRALLARRLRELEHAGVIQIRPKADGHGSLYEPTAVGRDLWPVLLALISQAAPPKVNATLMGGAFMSLFIGNVTMGWVGSFYAEMDPAAFWAMDAAIAFAGGLIVLIIGKTLSRALAPPPAGI